MGTHSKSTVFPPNACHSESCRYTSFLENMASFVAESEDFILWTTISSINRFSQVSGTLIFNYPPKRKVSLANKVLKRSREYLVFYQELFQCSRTRPWLCFLTQAVSGNICQTPDLNHKRISSGEKDWTEHQNTALCSQYLPWEQFPSVVTSTSTFQAY